MKKVFKYIGVGLIVLMAATFIFANIGKIIMAEQMKDRSLTLEQMIDSINTLLPAKGPDSLNFFIMDRVILEGQNVVWEATLDTTFFYPVRNSFLPESVNGGVLVNGDRTMALDLDTLITAEVLKKSQRCNLLYYYLFARSRKPNPFYDKIMSRQCSQIWRVHSPFSARQFEVIFTYQEQKDIESFYRNQTEKALQDFLSEYLNRQNLLLRIASINSDISMLMEDEGSSLVLSCVFDRAYSENGNKPISNLRAEKETVHTMLLGDAKALPIFYDMDDICKRTGKAFLIRYADFYKIDSIDFVIY